jgi:amino acid transporter
VAAVRDFFGAWGKFFRDLSSTRVQITLAVLMVWVLVVYRGVQVIRTAQDAATILSAVSPVAIATLGAWFLGKWLQNNTNGR